MNFSKKFKEKIKAAKTAEELAETAKSKNIELSAAEAEKAFIKLLSISEFDDREQDDFVFGKRLSKSNEIKWGKNGFRKNCKDLKFQFEVDQRVNVSDGLFIYRGIIIAREFRQIDRWVPMYLIHYDDSFYTDEWIMQG